jgi:hypothetical protein
MKKSSTIITKAISIIPYFGKWPEYFNLYLYSCSKNPIIDFYFFTDCPVPQRIYSNTHFINTNFNEYCNKISSKLNINFHPKQAYKLCDIRPFLGIIHDDLVSKYDFFGWSDIDLIYGDLSIMLSPYNLSHYNAFSTHADRLSGHFCLLKTNKYKSIGYKIKNWKEQLEKEQNVTLDELWLARVIYPDQRYRRGIKKLLNIPQLNTILDMPRILQWLTKKYQTEQFTTSIPSNSTEYLYKNGKIIDYNTKKELIYLHFMYYKGSSLYPTSFKWEQGFYKVSEEDLNKDIRINNKGIEVY